MKKTYSKPEISIESFQLSSSIANVCTGYQANSSDRGTCEIVENGTSIFNAQNEDCTEYSCYHTMNEDSTGVFGS